MRILSLELENIKSYRKASVSFTAGINAVCGQNGSGKTTILEAIGYALFDYLPYNQQQFVREGENFGIIRVALLAADGREYQITRRVGSGSAYYVFDVELNERVAGQKESVLRWIASNGLGIDATSHLETLFKNAIGVPQGLMTADFQVNAGARKSIFDPLLRVEEYRQAYEQLRATNQYVSSLDSALGEEVAALGAKLEGLAVTEAEEANLQALVAAGRLALEQLFRELGEVEAKKTEWDQARQRLGELERVHDTAEAQVTRRRDLLAHEERELGKAVLAQQAVAESGAGYLAVRAALEELIELEKDRNERDGLRAALAKVKGQIDGSKRQIARLEADVRQADESAGEAAALVERVRQQQDMEETVRSLASDLQRLAPLEQELGKRREALNSQEKEQKQRRERLAEACQAEEKARALPAAQSEVRAIEDQLAAIAPLREQRERVQAEGERLRKNCDRLRSDVEELRTARTALADAQAQASRHEELGERLELLRQERASAAATIEYQDFARASLREEHCPLLDLRCPVVSADALTLRRLDEQLIALTPRLDQIKTEIAHLEKELASVRAAATAVQSLEVSIARLSASETHFPEAEAELRDCRERYRELNDTVRAEPELQARRRQLQDQVQSLTAASGLAALRDSLEERHAEEEQRIAGLGAELETLEKEHNSVRLRTAEAAEIEQRLASLGDPRTQQLQHLAAVRHKTVLLDELRREEERLRSDTVQWDELSEKLQPYENLDEHVEHRRQIQRTHQAAYERYLAHQSEAARLEQCKQSTAAAADALVQAQAELEAAAEQRQKAAADYDEAAHNQVAEQFRTLSDERANQKAQLEAIERDYRRVENELQFLRRQQEKLLAKEAERHELTEIFQSVGFVRETIRAAGPAITETLLLNISQIANDIYAEIVDDHATELRWARDYDIVVQRGAETRAFAQLSGGEQMSAALSVRLALLKEMSDVNFAFFDEPTQNMDEERRGNLAGQIREIRGFEQLIVISHDDTFEHHTENLIRLRKMDEETHLESS